MTRIRLSVPRGRLPFAAPVMAALVLVGCGGGEEAAQEAAREAAQRAAEKAAQEFSAKAPETLEKAVGELAKAFGGEGVDTVSTELLREMLPETLAGMARTSLSASKNSAMGIKLSSAEAEYALDGASLTVNISDIGSMQGMARMGLDWISSEVYEENEDGFNRTVTYKGHKSIESYDTSAGEPRGNKLVFVAERFVIDINTVNLPFEKIEDVLATLPVEQLAGLSEG